MPQNLYEVHNYSESGHDTDIRTTGNPAATQGMPSVLQLFGMFGK